MAFSLVSFWIHRARDILLSRSPFQRSNDFDGQSQARQTAYSLGADFFIVYFVWDTLGRIIIRSVVFLFGIQYQPGLLPSGKGEWGSKFFGECLVLLCMICKEGDGQTDDFLDVPYIDSTQMDSHVRGVDRDLFDME